MTSVVRVRVGRPPLTRSRAAGGGLLAASVALAVLLLARAGGGSPGLLEVVVDGIARRVPPEWFDAAIDAVGGFAKGVLYAAVCAGVLAVGAGIAVAARGLGWLDRRSAAIATVGVSVASLGVVELLILPGAGAGLIGAGLLSDPPAVHLPIVIAAAAFGSVTVGLARLPIGAPTPGGSLAAQDGLARRSFLGRGLAVIGLVALGTSGTIVVARILGAAGKTRAEAFAATAIDGFGLAAAVTPVEQFYVVGKDWVALDADLARWRLRVGGLVDRPRDYAFAELTALPAVEAYRTLQCISNEVVSYGGLIGNQRWKGVRVRDLIAAAGPQANASHVVWRCADGYHESLPLDVANDELTWLVYEMGPPGTLLTPDHGAPIRLLVADRFGMAQPKHVTELLVTDVDEPGWWVRGGWQTASSVGTYCRIDFPRNDGISDGVLAGHTFTAFGVACAPTRGIDRVEVSVDGGATWRDAQLEPEGGPIGPLTWRRWRCVLRLDVPGDAVIVARATDGVGELQPAEVRETFPSGASGLPRVAMDVYGGLPDLPTAPPAVRGPD